MSRLSVIFGFSVSRHGSKPTYKPPARFSHPTYRVSPPTYRLGSEGIRALKLLAFLIQQAPPVYRNGWLLPLRPEIREIERLEAAAALTLVITHTTSLPLRCLAIWLRGRCGGTAGTKVIARFASAPERALRKEVARALKRMSGWAEVRRIAESDPDPQIRRIATQSASPPYEARLASFLQRLPRRLIPARQSRLIVSPDLDLSQGRPPKPRWLIGLLLERIHHLVRGSTLGRRTTGKPAATERPESGLDR